MISSGILGDLIITAVIRGGLYCLMAIGLSLVFGVMNIPNFAHGEFYMIGAYVAFLAYKFLGLNPLLSVLLAAIVGFAIGAGVEKGFFYPLRKKGQKQWVWIMNTFLVTVGLSIGLQNIIQVIFGTKYRGIEQYWQETVNILGPTISVDRVVGILIAAVTVIVFWLFLKKTAVGRAIRAVAQDEVGAKIVGINLNNIYTLTFALSSMLAGIAGAALLSVNPAYPTMGLMPLYSSWFVVIMVGLGNIGAIPVGALVIGFIETFSYYTMGAGWQKLTSILLIALILLFKPRGLFGSPVKGIWER